VCVKVQLYVMYISYEIDIYDIYSTIVFL
jgi:hypothetical protein